MPQQRPSGIARLPAFDPETGRVNAVVEAVRGSRNKFKFEPTHGLFVHDGSLPAGSTYPFDFGFIPGTKGEDGDPVDVLILMDEPAFVGAVVPARLVGAIKAVQTEDDGEVVRNDRLIAVAHKCHMYADARELSDLPSSLMGEVEHFWVSYNAQRDREFEVLGRLGARSAVELVKKQSRRRAGRRKAG
jgi:inorganic pyrophosphatase